MKKHLLFKFLLTFCLSLLLSVGWVNGQNLLLNGDVELWDDVNTPTSWTHIESITQELTTVHGGTYSAKHVGGTKDFGQSITVTAGNTYTISLWYYVEAGDGTDARIWSYWKSGGSSLADHANELRGPNGSYFPSTASWQYYEVTLTAPATADELYFEVRTYSSATVYWDDMSVTVPGDSDPPVWTSDYPKTANVESTTLDVVANMDEEGIAYYVVLTDGATAPTSAEVKAGTGSGGAGVEASGNIIITAATTDFSDNVTGLTASTAYDIYVVAEDDETSPNLQASPTLVDVTTAAADVTPPAWETGYPKTDNIANTDLDLLVSIDEKGTVYYVVLADGSTAPNSAQVIAGTDGVGAAAVVAGNISITAASTEFIDNISGLSDGTTYDIFVVAADDEGTPNIQATPAELADVTTTSIDPEPSQHAADLALVLDSPTELTLNWTDAAGAQLPAAYLILANETGTFTDPVDETAQADDTDLSDGSSVVNVAFGVETYQWTGLTENTTYYFKMYSYTNSGTAIDYKTDGTPPEINGTTPYISITDPAGGEKYYAGDNVTINWSSTNVSTVDIKVYIPSSDSWEIIADDTPSDGTEDIIIPTDADYSDLYRIAIVDISNSAVNDTTPTFTIVSTPTINDIQSDNDGDASNYVGNIVKTTGTVYYINSSNYWLQDGTGQWNSINVYDGATAATVTIGDNITVEAEVDEYNGLTQIKNVTLLSTNSAGNTILETTITTGTYDESYESVLIKVVNAKVTNPDLGSNEFEINDGSGALIIDDSYYEYIATANDDITITGIGYYSSNYKLRMRDANDIISASDTVTSTEYTINSETNVISDIPYGTDLATFEGNITACDTATFNVFDADGSTPATVLDETKKLIVTAADGITKRTYTIDIIDPSTDATLSDLLVEGTTVNEFVSTTYAYVVDLPTGTTDTPVVTEVENDPNANAVVTPATDVTSATEADRTTTVTVTAEDGTTTQDYTILFNVTPAGSDASLSDLQIDAVTVENFNTLVYEYRDTLAAGTTTVPEVTATANDVNATIDIVPATNLSSETEAERTTTVTVTAQDGVTEKVYTVIFYVLSDDATLSTLTVDGTEVTSFDPATLSYNVGLAYGTTDEPVVAATETDANASSVITQATDVEGDLAARTATVEVTAEDGLATKTYTVVFTVALNNDATITSTEYTVNSTAWTITDIPFTTTLAEFEGNLTPAANATFETYQADGTTVANDLATGYKVIVTAQDGTTTNTYTITVDEELDAELFFSEYVEGDGSNRAIEIYNPTDASIDLSIYTVKQSHNGTGWGTDGIAYVLPLEGTLTANEVYIIANASASTEILAEADTTFNYSDDQGHKVPSYTGNDALGLFKDDVLIDVIGIELEANPWNVADTTDATEDHTLLRKTGTVTGNTDWAASAGTNADNSEWIVWKIDSIANLGSFTPKSAEAFVTSTVYTVDDGLETITDIPYATTLATFEGNITPATGATFETYEANGATVATNLATGYKVIVTAENGTTTKTYTVTIDAASTEAFVTSTVYTVNNTENTITGIPITATLAEFEGNITPATDATFETYKADGTTVATDLATGYKVIVTAQDGTTTKVYTITINTTASNDATISSTVYTVDNGLETITAIPYGTVLVTFESNLTPAAAATFETYEADGTTEATDLATGCKVTVTAEDGTTTKTYTVTIDAASTEAFVTSTVYTVDNGLETITAIPYGTDIATFESNLTPAAGADFETYKADGITVATDLATGYKVIVTAEDGTTTKTYIITIDEDTSDLFFSEYIEGSSNNKALEIFNPTDEVAYLDNYLLKGSGNEATDWEYDYPFNEGDSILPNDVFVIVNGEAVQEMLDVADWISSGYECGFNGNDARGLFRIEGTDTTLIDKIGDENNPSGDDYSVAGIASGLAEHTILRKSSTTEGNTDWTASAGTNADDSEWEVKDVDYFDDLGFFGPKSGTDILTFDFVGQTTGAATIDATAHTVAIECAYETPTTALIATFTLSSGATAKVGATDQVSGTTANDFTSPVTYAVTAEDASTQNWVVTVSVSATQSTEADITKITVAGADSTKINTLDTTIVIYAPYGFNVTSIKPEFEISASATIVDTTAALDFTSPQTYVVTAQDGTSTKDWEVSVEVQEATELTIYNIQYTTETSGDSPYLGELIKTSGIVTAIDGGTLWIQDGTGAWNGVYIYSSATADTVTVGDDIEFVAVVDEYYGLTELKDVQDLNIISSGNTIPEPAVIAIDNAITEEYEGVLIKIANLEVTVLGGTYGIIYTATNGTETVYVDDNIYTQTGMTVGDKFTITGIVNYSRDNFRLSPRSADDIADPSTGIGDDFVLNSVKLYPNPSNGLFTLELNNSNNEEFMVEIYNVIGKIVYTARISDNLTDINITEMSAGIYYVSINNGENRKVSKIMIQ